MRLRVKTRVPVSTRGFLGYLELGWEVSIVDIRQVETAWVMDLFVPQLALIFPLGIEQLKDFERV